MEAYLATMKTQIGTVPTKWKNGFKASPLSMLAAIKLLKQHIPVVRKVNKDAVSLQMLQSKFNTTLGLDDHGVQPLLVDLIKEVLTQATAVGSSCLNGSCFKLAYKENDCNSRKAMLHKLGYTEVLPNPTKLITLARTPPVFEATDDKKQSAVKPVPRVNSDDASDPKKFPEASKSQRRMASLLIRIVNTSSPDKIAKQLKDQNLSGPSLECFKSQIGREVVDKLNMSYAILVTIDKRGKKSTPKLYNAVMGDLGSLISKLPNRYVDSLGRVFNNYYDIPVHIRNQIEKMIRVKSSPPQRPVIEAEVEKEHQETDVNEDVEDI